MKFFLNTAFQKILNFCSKKNTNSFLYFISFIESIFFPIPTDIFLIPYILANREKYFKIIFLTTIFSVLGGLVAYLIGLLFWYTILPWLNMNYPEIQNKVFNFQESFNKIGILLVIIGGFSPFPYKITCLGSGILGLNIYVFLISSFFSRWFRFFLVGYFFYKFNNEAKKFVYKYINIISVFIILCLVIYIIFFKN
ncbi:MAG: hypothetical protein CFH30_00003 [Alphaproteobacteria bacterium MarineAlpha8_Bin1]|nr:MAG: hypothetical protein CFH30_00003 [Alphaproteobacteria bacterium MarineAlpha8_Bin1]